MTGPRLLSDWDLRMEYEARSVVALPPRESMLTEDV